MPERRWWLVTYPGGVKQVEWMTSAEADVKQRAVAHPVKRVEVKDLEGEVVKGPEHG